MATNPLYDVPADENDAFMQARNEDFQKWLFSSEKAKGLQQLWKDTGAQIPESTKQKIIQSMYANEEDGEQAFRKNWLNTRGDRRAKMDADKSQASVDSAIQEFYNSMNGPIDMNDPEVKAIVAGASNSAERQAKLAGVQGGMAVSNTQNAVAGSLAGLGMQRKQLGLQALGMRNQRGLTLAQMAEESRLADRGYANQMAQQRRAQGLAQSQGVGAMIGGGLGALGFLGGPAVGAATMQAGAAIGGGVGGLAYNDGGGSLDRFASSGGSRFGRY